MVNKIANICDPYGKQERFVIQSARFCDPCGDQDRFGIKIANGELSQSEQNTGEYARFADLDVR